MYVNTIKDFYPLQGVFEKYFLNIIKTIGIAVEAGLNSHDESLVEADLVKCYSTKQRIDIIS
jgi:hypothetical protein